MSMTIKCSKLPCDVEWDIFQSEKGDLSDTTKISQLYKIENTTRHMILAFSCNKDDVTDFPSLISLHSNLNFYRFGR